MKILNKSRMTEIYVLIIKWDTLITAITTRNIKTPAPVQVWEMGENLIFLFFRTALTAFPLEEKLPVLLFQATVPALKSQDFWAYEYRWQCFDRREVGLSSHTFHPECLLNITPSPEADKQMSWADTALWNWLPHVVPKAQTALNYLDWEPGQLDCLINVCSVWSALTLSTPCFWGTECPLGLYLLCMQLDQHKISSAWRYSGQFQLPVQSCVVSELIP